MDRLQFGVSEVSRHFAATFLIFQAILGQFLTGRFHTETNDVFSAYGDQFLRFFYFFLAIYDQQRNVQQKRAETVYGLVEFARRS